LFRGFRKPRSPAFPCYGATASEAAKRCITIRFGRWLASGQHNPLFEYGKIDGAEPSAPGADESAGEPIARADTSISKQYLFSVVGWIIGLPRAGRPSADPQHSQSKKWNSNMKTMTRFVISRQSRAKLAAVAFVALLGSALSVSDANAFSCGRSAFGGGCIGPRGAVGVNRNGAVVVGRYGNVYAYHRGSACFWHNNQRICP
jgi:hypothetical protein